jgi:hypothetical protein
MRFYCDKYKGHKLTQVCMFFLSGMEYSCLQKGTGYRACPWNGKPFSVPTGYFLSPKDMIQSPFGYALSDAPVHIE